MSRAISLARRHQKSQYSKPIVGCVIVKDSQVIGEGITELEGDHAEVAAIKSAGSCKGATAYVTLEPCNHDHRSPSCVQALVAAGVLRVVYGAIDTNPLVNGGGVRELCRRDILVSQVMSKDAEHLHRFFLYAQHRNIPYIIQKVAMSSDYKLTTRKGEKVQVTGKMAMDYAHNFRSVVDAILVGSETVVVDNPHLSARDQVVVSQPLRVVLDRRLRTDPTSNIYSDGNVVIFTTPKKDERSKEKMQSFASANIPVVVIGETTSDRFLMEVLRELKRRGIFSVLVEGGAHVHESFLKLPFEREVMLYISGAIFGDLAVPALGNLDVKEIIKKLNILEEIKLGEDKLVWGKLPCSTQ